LNRSRSRNLDCASAIILRRIEIGKVRSNDRTNRATCRG
jgi:hypothetical protein